MTTCEEKQFTREKRLAPMKTAATFPLVRVVHVVVQTGELRFDADLQRHSEVVIHSVC